MNDATQLITNQMNQFLQATRNIKVRFFCLPNSFRLAPAQMSLDFISIFIVRLNQRIAQNNKQLIKQAFRQINRVLWFDPHFCKLIIPLGLL